MKTPSKVLWCEGIMLRPQQFQQQDRYHEARLHRITSALHPYPWGVIDAAWNREALENNLLRADALTLLFQDGELYEAPAGDELPVPVDLAPLPAAQDSFTFHAALPLFKSHGGNYSGSQRFQQGARYAQVEAETPDLYTEAVDAEVAYLRKTVMLLPESAPRGATTHFPVLRIRRRPQGGFEAEPNFIAPAVAIGASPALSALLDGLLIKLGAKLDALRTNFRAPGHGMLDLQGADTAAFMMTHAISGAYAAFGHLARCRTLHPERLYQELLSLAGGLAAFSGKAEAARLPAYDHLRLDAVFGQLDGIVRELVDTVISSRFFMVPLTRDASKATLHRGALPMAKMDSQARLFLAVTADLGLPELVAAVPARFKVGAPDDVERSMLSALPGIALAHLPQLPPGMPVRPRACYFALDGKGPLYENMLRAQAVAIYAPEGMRELGMELIGLSA